jgi:hypothetical protein
LLLFALHPRQELGGPVLQALDLPEHHGGRVRVDVVGRRLLPDVAAAKETGADQRGRVSLAASERLALMNDERMC